MLFRQPLQRIQRNCPTQLTGGALTTLVYAAPSPELKKAQRAFFAALYQLLCSSDTGPRLPTLLLSIGPDRAHHLLDGQQAEQ